MMMPAWMPRLKDLKVLKSKQKQSKAPFLSPSSTSVSKSLDSDASMCFMKALSLQRANVKARCARLEGSLGHSTDTDSIFSSCDNDAHMCMQPPDHTSADADVATAKLCSYGSDERFRLGELPLHDLDSKGSAFQSYTMSDCVTEVGPHLYEGKKRMASCAQNDLYGAIENDTQSSNVLTPNTIESSFGSESSSTNSSVVRKCGYSEDRRRRVTLWQEGDSPESLEGGLEELVYLEEAPLFTDWQDISSSEDLQSARSVEMQDISRLSYRERVLNSCKFLESSSGNLSSVRRLDMEAMSRLTYNEGHLNQQQRSSWNVAGNHGLTSFQECHTSAFHASKILPGCVFTLWYEGSPGFPNSSLSPMPLQKEKIKSCPLGLVNSNLQKESCINAGNCIKEGCKVSITPSICKERSNFDGTMLWSSSCSEWEETSALIAVENPGLMLSSKWHERLQNPSLEISAGASQNSDLSMYMGQDSRSGTSTCVSQDSDVGLSMCVQQCDANGSSVCSQQDDGNAGFHKSIHAAYLRRGRRFRGSSFSAVLPKDLQGVVGDSIALVKMSHNPYEDFRHSMYEMIMEKDLEESMDVEELLYCYLSLNSPEHHELIEEVFSDVWSSILMSVR